MRAVHMMGAAVAAAVLHTAEAYNNGPMTLKPPLGWQTWCSAGPCGTDHCFDEQIRATADAMKSNGMGDLGFEWIILDDCWHPTRTGPNNSLVPHPEFFPNGMKPVIDYVHSLGLKFGLYTSVGTVTCHGGWSPGSYGHWDIDAQTFASWGVDYVKVDYCGALDSPNGHRALSKALNATGRPIVLELCRGPYQTDDAHDWSYAPDVAQVWRATNDHHDDFSSTMKQVAAMSSKGNTAYGPYGWAYGDMMMTGGQGCPFSGQDPPYMKPQHCPGQTDNEYRTEVSLYAVLSSPMMIGTDIRNMTAIMNETLLNPDMIAINQDYRAEPGAPTALCGNRTQAWTRKLSDGRVAVAVPNLGLVEATMTVCLADLGMPASATVKDVWAKKDLGKATSGSISGKVAVHDTWLLLVSQS
eukprot:CAMPEP_0182928406 /NCGR_PEP_ID=MMETSP0105_2-20130417/15570_1 /TAXON_ID=81532 ORGANISM="Acanthoeca-like sp., Strain 10tr" /NCGR_SAMPLE_ID=MMETSP0105_2 /ASSEMBLY_ACC=CAM_ASM_000205 /LENGTH=411 /DNA_ID=CAMNT_0025066409 /DNA_START=30 /DNA_END=1265 /DNA_ORIENTATION=-